MSDNNQRSSLTPIVVGVVIALLGIFIGLYIAENAREQLAAASGQPVDESASDTEANISVAAGLADLPPADATVADLPPLEPIVVDALPEIDDDEPIPVAEPALPEAPDVSGTQPEPPIEEPAASENSEDSNSPADNPVPEVPVEESSQETSPMEE